MRSRGLGLEQTHVFVQDLYSFTLGIFNREQLIAINNRIFRSLNLSTTATSIHKSIHRWIYMYIYPGRISPSSLFFVDIFMSWFVGWRYGDQISQAIMRKMHALRYCYDCEWFAKMQCHDAHFTAKLLNGSMRQNIFGTKIQTINQIVFKHCGHQLQHKHILRGDEVRFAFFCA